jgi:hypothetical protein
LLQTRPFSSTTGDPLIRCYHANVPVSPVMTIGIGGIFGAKVISQAAEQTIGKTAEAEKSFELAV